jgi:hypothetical protein
MEKGSDNFWESALLQNRVNKCIYHLIAPTIMTVDLPLWDEIKGTFDQNDTEFIQAQYDHLCCTYCKKDMQSQNVRLGIRIIIAYEDIKICHRYDCTFNDSIICHECINLPMVPTFESDNIMIEIVLERLRTIGRGIRITNAEHRIDGIEFMRQLMVGFHTDYTSFIRQIRKLDAKECRYCKKCAKKLFYCSMCCYVRYCGSECQKADWKRHKAECNFLKHGSIFLDYKKYGKRIK